MTQQEDAPVRTFGTVYTLAVWTGFAIIVLVLGWLVWTLFQSSPSGTVRSETLDVVRPTQTALAAAFAGEDVAVVVKLPSTCAACHTIEGTDAAGKTCPNLTHVGSVAATRIEDAKYLASDGAATSVEEYIRESILEPSIFCVDEVDTYCTANGTSVMPATVGALLTPQELDRLVTYLASLD
ncbi:MAG: c-type cytochrome [Anaerolineae bacterium]|jgi:cytochrome c2